MATETEPQGKRAPFVVEWRDGFKINIPSVDAEHKRLFELIRELKLETVDQTIEELLAYVVTHFTNEQALMEKSQYPALEQHIKLHEDFGNHVADFLGTGNEWSEERIQDLRRFLNKWLIGHIMTHDLRFGNWYSQHQGTERPDVKGVVKQRGLLARLLGLH